MNQTLLFIATGGILLSLIIVFIILFVVGVGLLIFYLIKKITSKPDDSTSKYEVLAKLKKLYDDGIISKEEYAKEKSKILE